MFHFQELPHRQSFRHVTALWRHRPREVTSCGPDFAVFELPEISLEVKAPFWPAVACLLVTGQEMTFFKARTCFLGVERTILGFYLPEPS